MAVEEVTRGIGLALAALFMLAVIPKLAVLRARGAADEPVIRASALLRRHPRSAIRAVVELRRRAAAIAASVQQAKA